MKEKKINILEVGTKKYSLALGALLTFRKELAAHKHAQLAALTMHKIATKIQLLGFDKYAQKLFGHLGVPVNGLYEDITENKKLFFIETITTCWEQGYQQNEEAKQTRKIQKRKETLERLAQKKQQKDS